jgi:hypothetical protein
MTEQPPRDAAELQAARQAELQKRKARKKRQRKAQMAGASVAAQPLGRIGRTSSAFNPLARRVGRIGKRMVIRQIIKMLLRVVLRR